MQRDPSHGRTGPVVSIHDAELWRGERRLFAGLSGTVRPGEILLISGANGSGKTSLLRAVCGLVPMERGHVACDGTPVRRDLAAFRARLAFLGHLTPLKAELSAYENLCFLMALRSEPPRWTPGEALERLGVSAVADQPARTLSAGQRRRVALAAVAASGAAVWVLDEPYTSLDAAGETLVDGLLAEHAASGGSVLVASHRRPDRGQVRYQEITLTDSYKAL